MIEVLDYRFCERLAERRHDVLPTFFSDNRESLDVGEVFNGKLGVLPHRCGFPAVQVSHVEQQTQLSMLPDESLELGHKVLVIRSYQLPADANDEHSAVVFFIDLNGPCRLL